jgi:NAD(P)-dependent dehydrogenase (short-subunit alcohol dehydrogenase family)
MLNNWSVKDIPSQKGKFVVVTGATGGLGFETALGLSSAGAEVILAGRDGRKGKLALERIARAAPGANVRFGALDLASLQSVRAFAGTLMVENKPLDILINNAGVMDLPSRVLTADGFEMQFGTNHLGHFALTGLVLPLLRRARSSRVVNVSSMAHRGGKIEFDNLQAERRYRGWNAYQQSKLANLLFTFELQRRSDAGGWGLISNAAHPGYARTDLITNGPGDTGLIAIVSAVLRPLVSQSATEGALPTLFEATSPEAEPLGYYGPKHFFELKGPVAPAYVSPRAKDKTVAKELWDISEHLTGVRW